MRRLPLPAPILLLLVLLAFALGMASERWLNGARRRAALEWYERAVRDYGPGHPAPPPLPPAAPPAASQR